MKPTVYKNPITPVVTFTISGAGEIGDGVVRAMWEGILRTAEGKAIVRAAGEAIVRVAGEVVVRAAGERVERGYEMKSEEAKKIGYFTSIIIKSKKKSQDVHGKLKYDRRITRVLPRK